MSFCRLESRGNGFLVLTMASADEHNYLTEEAITELVEVLKKVGNNAEAKGLVTTCEAGTFCAGLDYDHHAESEEQAEHLAGRVAEVIRLLLELPVPTVAAVRGNATSLGLALALAHDHCFVWDHAVLGLPEARRGRRLPDYVATLLRDKLSFARLRKLLMLRSQTCTGKELAGTWWSTHGADGNRQVVLDKAVDLLYDVQVGDGANFAKTRQMLCGETCAAVGITITMEKHKPQPTPAELDSHKAAGPSQTSVMTEKTPKWHNHDPFVDMYKDGS
ncbi:hypothetical protein CFC21_000171 [Triticum aestivum]|uniref:Uncharacterized protein n=2 Tax=Triticum aestivum TaxID=4565 RepID=A0A3B5XUD3_WHEAT|nr:enoyl-CoA delta isomerase 2, peroxisomal-like isoform X1 [Triticum aestivum]KAF6981712.1 hypothetical protein CFC21_000171 [Triticum aestivum]